MRACSLILCLALSWLPAADAATSCAEIAQEVASLEWEDFEDVLEESMFDTDCRELREAVFDRLDVLLTKGEVPEDLEDEQIDEVLIMAANVRLGAALWRQDEPRARELVAELLALHRTEAEPAPDSEFETSGLDDDVVADEEDPSARSELDAILAVLDRTASKEWKREVEAPEPEWTLRFGRCGTGAAILGYFMALAPTRADAWVAVDEPELALQTLLVGQWTSALSSGIAPPRLREFAQRAFGPGHYEVEIENALAAIRIESGVAGRRARMPLFGLDVPLPVAIQSWREEAPTVFEDEQVLATYMRDLLLDAGDE